LVALVQEPRAERVWVASLVNPLEEGTHHVDVQEWERL
jgi:hypothetical protein